MPALPKLPKLPNLNPAQLNLPNAPSLPNIPTPKLPIPPGVGRLIPSRTVTSLIPGRVRDFVRYANIVQQIVPGAFQGKLEEPKPIQRKEIKFTPVPILRGFLADAETGRDILYFQYNPEEIQVDHDTGWIVTNMPGRSHPFIQWGGSGQRKISFTLKLSYNVEAMVAVVDTVNWIHSFMYPVAIDQDTGIVSSPKPLFLFLGHVFTKGANPETVPCILLRAPVTYSRIFRPTTLTPLYAEIRLELLALLPTNTVVQTGPASRSTVAMEEFRTREDRGLTNADAAIVMGTVLP